MKNFVGKTVTSPVPFMDGSVDVKRLSVAETLSLQSKSKELKTEGPEAEAAQLDLIVGIVRQAVEDAKDLSDDEIKSFPIEELTRIADSALGNKADSAGNEG